MTTSPATATPAASPPSLVLRLLAATPASAWDCGAGRLSLAADPRVAFRSAEGSHWWREPSGEPAPDDAQLPLWDLYLRLQEFEQRAADVALREWVALAESRASRT